MTTLPRFELLSRDDDESGVRPRHDLNNQITIILGSVELALREQPARESTRAHLERIKRAALRASDLCMSLAEEAQTAGEVGSAGRAGVEVKSPFKTLR